MKIWHMRVPCWIPRASNTHSDCVIRIAVPGQQWLNEHPSVRRYTYSALSVLLVLMSPLQPRAAPSYCITCGNKMPTRCNRGFYCRSYCCSTCFGHHCAHQLRVMCPVCRMLQHSANQTHNPQLHTRPATWKPQHEVPQAATTAYYSLAPDDGHSGVRNMLSKQ